MRRLGLILVAAVFCVGFAFANGFALDNGDGSADTLSAYLHGHRLPLVEARIVTNESGQRTLMLYGFVATSYGKRDAEDQARDFMDDPDIEIINHIRVRPELLTMGTGTNNSDTASSLDAPPVQDSSGDGTAQGQEQAASAQADAGFPDTIGDQQDYANQERDDEFLLSNGVGFSGVPLAMVILGSGAIMPPLTPPFAIGPTYPRTWPPIANQPPVMFPLPPVIVIRPPVYQPPNRFAGFPGRFGPGYYPSPYPAGPTPMFPATGGMPPFPSAFGPGFNAGPGFNGFGGAAFPRVLRRQPDFRAASASAIADLNRTTSRSSQAWMAAPLARELERLPRTAILICCLVAFAAGCHRGPASTSPSLNIALAVFPAEARHYQDFAAEFEHRSGIHPRLVAQSYVDILRALQAEAAAGSGVLDLVELDLATLSEARPDVAAVDELITPAARKLFPAAAWEAATSNRHVFFVPHRLMWQAMIYNHVEVPTPPANWAELAAFAKDHPGKLAIKGGLYEGAVCDAMPFVWAAGGREQDPSAPGSLEAMRFLATLAPGLNPLSQVFREMSVLEAQARGQVWIHFNWPFAMGYLAGKGLAPQIDLSAPIPAGPAGSFAVLGGGYLAIPRSAPHPQAAREFVRYLLTAQTQVRLSRGLGWYGSVPPLGSEQARLYAGFTAMRDQVRARPAIPGYTALSNRWQRIIHEVLFDEIQPAAAAASQP